MSDVWITKRVGGLPQPRARLQSSARTLSTERGQPAGTSRACNRLTEMSSIQQNVVGVQNSPVCTPDGMSALRPCRDRVQGCPVVDSDPGEGSMLGSSRVVAPGGCGIGRVLVTRVARG